MSGYFNDRCVSRSGKRKVGYTEAQARAAVRNQPNKSLQTFLCTSCGRYHVAESKRDAIEMDYNMIRSLLG